MKSLVKHSVFIVDDDPDDRESIRDAFLENNHDQNYMFMKSGEELLMHLNQAPVVPHGTVVLLDLNMPGKGGNEVLTEIKTNSSLKTIPVIIFTTSSSDSDKRLSYKLGANCFVTKPGSYKDLIALTNSIAKLWFVSSGK